MIASTLAETQKEFKRAYRYIKKILTLNVPMGLEMLYSAPQGPGLHHRSTIRIDLMSEANNEI